MNSVERKAHPMNTPLLDPTVPRQAADWLKANKWLRGPGDGKTTGCLHTALLRPCSTPGDNVIWHLLERLRGHDEHWNDRQAEDKSQVLDVLRNAPDPTEAEMVELLGPQWQAIRDLIRRAATLTDEEAKALDAARDAARGASWRAACGAAWDAAQDAAWAAARDASSRDAARDAAWDAAWGAARDAAVALVVRDLIGQHGFTADHYRALTRPWASVVGPAHPDDIADGLVAK